MFIELSISSGFDIMKENAKGGNVFVPMNLVFSVFNIFEGLVTDAKEKEEIILSETGCDPNLLKALSCLFVFSYVWIFGGHADAAVRISFDSFARDVFGALNLLPSHGMLYDYLYRSKTFERVAWNDNLPSFKLAVQNDIPPEERNSIKFHSLLVPTIDTARFSFLFQLLSRHRKHIFVRGSSWVGKSIILSRAMKELGESG
jgi:dynein heavy chain